MLNLTSEKYVRKSGFKLALLSSWFKRVILTDSDLSFEALPESLISIWSRSSLIRYLSKSLPYPSDNYKIIYC